MKKKTLPTKLRADRSAPQAHVAHGLAGGAALCGGQVHLAAGAHAHLKQLLFWGSPGG